MRTLSILFIFLFLQPFLQQKSFDSIVIFCPCAFIQNHPDLSVEFSFIPCNKLWADLFSVVLNGNTSRLSPTKRLCFNRNGRSFRKRNVMLNARLGSGGGEFSQHFQLRYGWVVRWLVGCLAGGLFLFFIF